MDESNTFHLVNSVGEYRREGRDEFAAGIKFAMESLGANVIEPGFVLSFEGLPFTSFMEARAVIETCRAHARGDTDDALALRNLLDPPNPRLGRVTGEVFRDAEGIGIKFTFGSSGNLDTTWRPVS